MKLSRKKHAPLPIFFAKLSLFLVHKLSYLGPISKFALSMKSQFFLARSMKGLVVLQSISMEPKRAKLVKQVSLAVASLFLLNAATHIQLSPITDRVRFLTLSDDDMNEINLDNVDFFSEMTFFPKSDPMPQTIEMLVQILMNSARDLLPESTLLLYPDVHLSNSKEVNAFATSNMLVIFRGLITSLDDNMSSIAGVMAHELSHNILKHSIERTSNSNFFDIIVGVLTTIPSFSSAYSTLAAFRAFTFAKDIAGVYPYSRSSEVEADRVGFLLHSLSGFDPRSFIHMMDGLARGTFLSTDMVSSILGFKLNLPSGEISASNLKAAIDLMRRLSDSIIPSNRSLMTLNTLSAKDADKDGSIHQFFSTYRNLFNKSKSQDQSNMKAFEEDRFIFVPHYSTPQYQELLCQAKETSKIEKTLHPIINLNTLPSDPLGKSFMQEDYMELNQISLLPHSFNIYTDANDYYQAIQDFHIPIQGGIGCLNSVPRTKMEVEIEQKIIVPLVTKALENESDFTFLSNGAPLVLSHYLQSIAMQPNMLLARLDILANEKHDNDHLESIISSTKDLLPFKSLPFVSHINQLNDLVNLTSSEIFSSLNGHVHKDNNNLDHSRGQCLLPSDALFKAPIQQINYLRYKIGQVFKLLFSISLESEDKFEPKFYSSFPILNLSSFISSNNCCNKNIALSNLQKERALNILKSIGIKSQFEKKDKNSSSNENDILDFDRHLHNIQVEWQSPLSFRSLEGISDMTPVSFSNCVTKHVMDLNGKSKVELNEIKKNLSTIEKNLMNKLMSTFYSMQKPLRSLMGDEFKDISDEILSLSVVLGSKNMEILKVSDEDYEKFNQRNNTKQQLMSFFSTHPVNEERLSFLYPMVLGELCRRADLESRTRSASLSANKNEITPHDQWTSDLYPKLKKIIIDDHPELQDYSSNEFVENILSLICSNFVMVDATRSKVEEFMKIPMEDGIRKPLQLRSLDQIARDVALRADLHNSVCAKDVNDGSTKTLKKMNFMDSLRFKMGYEEHLVNKEDAIRTLVYAMNDKKDSLAKVIHEYSSAQSLIPNKEENSSLSPMFAPIARSSSAVSGLSTTPMAVMGMSSFELEVKKNALISAILGMETITKCVNAFPINSEPKLKYSDSFPILSKLRKLLSESYSSHNSSANNLSEQIGLFSIDEAGKRHDVNDIIKSYVNTSKESVALNYGELLQNYGFTR